MTTALTPESTSPQTTTPAWDGLGAAQPDERRDALIAFQERYRYNWQLAVRELFQAVPEPWQDEVLAYIDERRIAGMSTPAEGYAIRVSVASGHGVGKSTLLSWLAILHSITLYPQKTAITAPSAPQLFDALWPEIKSWINRLPPLIRTWLDPKADRIELAVPIEGVNTRAESFISAKTSRSDQSEALQGVHSVHVLLMIDEWSGVPDQVMDSASGSMSGRRVIVVGAGNPLHGQGYFFDTHHKLARRWKTWNVSVFDSKYADPAFAEDIIARYGKDGNHYRTRVLGLFPLADDDAVIPSSLLLPAVGREIKAPRDIAPIWGLDVAYKGSHRTALVKRRGPVVTEPPLAWQGLDDAQVVGRVRAEWDATPVSDRPSDINVDAIGYGAAVARGLRALGLPANAVNVAELPAFGDTACRNLRCELWFRGRKWFADRDCSLPNFDPDGRIEDLVEELAGPSFKPQPISGKLVIDEKKGRRSPDLADAFLLTFASDAVTIAGLGETHRDWKTELDFALPGLV